MIVIYSDLASETIENISEFIDDVNTPGAGERWVERLVKFIGEYAAVENTTWALCRNNDLAALGMSCLVYSGWIIVFQVHDKRFYVYQIIYGPLLS